MKITESSHASHSTHQNHIETFSILRNQRIYSSYRNQLEEVPAQDLRDVEDDMSVGNLLERVGTEPFPEFHHPLLMAGRTEMTALAREGQKIFVVAIPALRPGKALGQVAAFQVAVKALLQIGTSEPARHFESLLVDLNKGFKMVLFAEEKKLQKSNVKGVCKHLRAFIHDVKILVQAVNLPQEDGGKLIEETQMISFCS